MPSGASRGYLVRHAPTQMPYSQKASTLGLPAAVTDSVLEKL